MKAVSFNRNWIFTQEGTDRRETVILPHDAMIHTDRDPGQPIFFLLAGYHGGKYCYEKEYIPPHEDADKCTILEFEGVYCMTSVYVNGKKVKEKYYGFTEFSVDISDELKYGEKNIIRVIADVPYDGHNRWYTGGGIYRPVNLYIAPRQHIDLYGVGVTTKSVNPAVVNVTTSHTGEGAVKVSIYDGQECICEQWGTDVDFEVEDAKLWNAEHPNLYRVKAQLYDGGRCIDESEEEFGIRMITADAENGLCINGEREFLRGGCIHNDNGVIGVVNNDATELHRASVIKDSGFNAVRSAHHPMSRSLLKACDRVGLYVMNEAFDFWYRPKTQNPYGQHFMECYEEDITAMVQSSYNHPCVILYSIGNEIPEAGGVKGVRIGRSMVDMIHRYDQTRLTTLCPSVHWLREYLDGTPYLTVDEDAWIAESTEHAQADEKHYAGIFMGAAANIPEDEKGMSYPTTYVNMDENATKNLYPYLDVAGYNYFEDNYDVLHSLHPERVLLGTETRADRIVDTMRYARKHPYLIGDFVWTLQEHLGEANCCNIQYGEMEVKPGIPRGMQGKDYPWLINYGGVLDLIGHTYPALHRFELAWGKTKGIFMASQPPVHGGIAPSVGGYKWTDTVSGWSYGGCEGEKTFIDVYTDACEAEVWVNDVSIGRKEVKDFWAKFPCTYEPGEVVAVGYDADGKELYRESMKTALQETIITAKPDKTKLAAGGEDFCFVDISITDKDGTLKRLPEYEIHIKVEGAGTLQGFGSAYHMNTEKYNQSHHKTYLGCLQAVIRSSTEAGVIRIVLSADGLESSVTQLTCV